MEKKSLLQQQIAGYQVTLLEDGSITLHKDKSLIGQGSLDSVVLTQWGEAHLDGCNARLGKTQDESYEIYDQIDDALSVALTENHELRAQLCLPRNKEQLELIADDWSERLSKEERATLQSDTEALRQKIERAEYLSEEQSRQVIAHLKAELRS